MDLVGVPGDRKPIHTDDFNGYSGAVAERIADRAQKLIRSRLSSKESDGVSVALLATYRLERTDAAKVPHVAANDLAHRVTTREGAVEIEGDETNSTWLLQR